RDRRMRVGVGKAHPVRSLDLWRFPTLGVSAPNVGSHIGKQNSLVVRQAAVPQLESELEARDEPAASLTLDQKRSTILNLQDIRAAPTEHANSHGTFPPRGSRLRRTIWSRHIATVSVSIQVPYSACVSRRCSSRTNLEGLKSMRREPYRSEAVGRDDWI